MPDHLIQDQYNALISLLRLNNRNKPLCLPLPARHLPGWGGIDQQSQSSALQHKQHVRQHVRQTVQGPGDSAWNVQCLSMYLDRQCRQVFGGQSTAHAWHGSAHQVEHDMSTRAMHSRRLTSKTRRELYPSMFSRSSWGRLRIPMLVQKSSTASQVCSVRAHRFRCLEAGTSPLRTLCRDLTPGSCRTLLLGHQHAATRQTSTYC